MILSNITDIQNYVKSKYFIDEVEKMVFAEKHYSKTETLSDETVELTYIDRTTFGWKINGWFRYTLHTKKGIRKKEKEIGDNAFFFIKIKFDGRIIQAHINP